MATSLTRRRLVCAAPAAVVAASLPTLASGAHPDAALLALREPYERTLASVEAVSPAQTIAEDAYYAAQAAYPGLDRDTLEKISGLDVAEANWQAALDLNTEVIAQIIDTPAWTIEGVIFKAKICEREGMYPDPDLAESIVADLVAMGAANA